MKIRLSAIVLLLFAPLALAQFDEGIEYKTLSVAQPTDTGEKIEVRELFSYGCPHCYHFEPDIKAWLANKPDDVEFVRMAAVVRPEWEILARGWYTAQLLDAGDRVHAAIFDRIHKQRKPIRNVAELRDIFVANGVSAEDFDKTYNSFAVITRTNRSKQIRNLYGVGGVPTLVVNGKYITSPNMAGGNQKVLEVVDFLVAKERAAQDTAADDASAEAVAQ